MGNNNDNILANLIRVGTVSATNAGKLKARVIFKDKDGMTSGWLPVIQRRLTNLSIVPDAEHSHRDSIGGTTNKFSDHVHDGSVTTTWMPRVGDTVLVVYLPVANADGFVLGAI